MGLRRALAAGAIFVLGSAAGFSYSDSRNRYPDLGMQHAENSLYINYQSRMARQLMSIFDDLKIYGPDHLLLGVLEAKESIQWYLLEIRQNLQARKKLISDKEMLKKIDEQIRRIDVYLNKEF